MNNQTTFANVLTAVYITTQLSLFLFVILTVIQS